MKLKKIFIWDTSMSNMLEGKPFGGIAVQLYFWAQVFASNEWEVYALTTQKEQYTKHNIQFKCLKSSRHLSIIDDLIKALYFIFSTNPNLVIIRGASNRLFNLSLIARLLGKKLVFMGASDVNFVPGEEQIKGPSLNRILYQIGLKKVKYIVTQNEYQTKKAIEHYHKIPLQLNNIWGDMNLPAQQFANSKSYDVVWIANIRKLKRLEWLLDVASATPEYSFAVAGKCFESQQYEEKLVKRMKSIHNLDYLGEIGIADSSRIVKTSKLLVCTSEFEGFPNTFLQAWSVGIPVVSTVNPNDVITEKKLGIVAETTAEIKNAIQDMLTNIDKYKEYQSNIEKYFKNNHDPEVAFKLLTQYVNIGE